MSVLSYKRRYHVISQLELAKLQVAVIILVDALQT
jgi:hypothetical protein